MQYKLTGTRQTPFQKTKTIKIKLKSHSKCEETSSGELSLQISLIGSICGCIECQGGGEEECNFEGCLSG